MSDSPRLTLLKRDIVENGISSSPAVWVNDVEMIHTCQKLRLYYLNYHDIKLYKKMYDDLKTVFCSKDVIESAKNDVNYHLNLFSGSSTRKRVYNFDVWVNEETDSNGIKRIWMPLLSPNCNFTNNDEYFSTIDLNTSNIYSTSDSRSYFFMHIILHSNGSDITICTINQNDVKKVILGSETRYFRSIEPTFLIQSINAKIKETNSFWKRKHIEEIVKPTLNMLNRRYQEKIMKSKVSKYSLHEECIARAWHPRRFMDWCLDEDEKRDLLFDLQ